MSKKKWVYRKNGYLSHSKCYGTDKTTQKSGYGELTRLRKNSPTGSDTAYEVYPERSRFSACFVPVHPQVIRQTPISFLTGEEEKEEKQKIEGVMVVFEGTKYKGGRENG